MSKIKKKIKDFIKVFKSVKRVIKIIQPVNESILNRFFYNYKKANDTTGLMNSVDIIDSMTKDEIIGEISDGCHTFSELYYHRMILFATLCNMNKELAWKSKKHNDGTKYDNYFIVGIDTPNGQFTYHFEMKYWDNFDIRTTRKAHKWDGHTSKDVTRLLSLADKNYDNKIILYDYYSRFFK